ncbi:putative inactive poly [ADP-ribose] polymerase SRO2 [Silene latifolia]|uniref:putative inactive poly [ADP-ribose] polymerase SRO2 n=1 Tax=Silene latifolia TaxID=37657 RepID=UPI003D77EC45
MENQIQSRFNQFPENNYHDDGNNNQHGYDDDDDEQVSDCESVISNNSDYYDELFGDDDDLVRLEKEDPIHNALHNKFLSCLGDVGNKTSVVAIHKKVWSNSIEGNSRRHCFEIYRQALKNKYGDDNNMKFAWYGTSKEDIARIMSRGFGINDIPNWDGVFDDGINFFPIKFLNQSLNSCVMQDDGLKHVLLSRVLLEREDYSNYDIKDDDDEDEVVSPTTYVIKSTKMNTHILPEYVISFKTPLPTLSLKSTLSSAPTNSFNATPKLKKPISPWLTFSTLILALAKLLPPQKISLVSKLHMDLKARKISRLDFIEKLKRLVGVNLLIVVVKLCGAKEGSFFKVEQQQQQQQLRSMRRAMGKCGCRGHKICKSNKITVACAKS